MKSLKLFANLFASLCLVFASTFAQASSPLSVSMLNYTSNVDNMERDLKSFFTTQEDHRVISKEFIKLRSVAKKWIWRYEKSGDGIAFRLNGRVQYNIQIPTDASNHVLVNGKKVNFKKGQSFKAFYDEALKAVNNKTANLDFLIFNEAEAFGIFGMLLVAGIAAVALGAFSGKASASSRRCNPKGARASSPFSQGNVNTAAKHYSRSCNGNRVAVNGKFYTCNNWQSVEDCVNYKVENGAFGRRYKTCKSAGTFSDEGDSTGNEWSIVPGGTSGKETTTSPAPAPQGNTSGISQSGRCAQVWNLCRAAYSATSHCTGESQTSTPQTQARRSCNPKTTRYQAVRPFTGHQVGVSARQFRKVCGPRTYSCKSFADAQACARWKAGNSDRAFGNRLSYGKALEVCQAIETQIDQCIGSGGNTPDDSSHTTTFEGDNPNDWSIVPGDAVK